MSDIVSAINVYGLVGSVCLEDGVIAPRRLGIANGVIACVEDIHARLSTDLVLRDGEVAFPGFIDVQLNGAFGVEVKTKPEQLGVILKRMPEFGVTSVVPTVTTLDVSEYRGVLERLEQASDGVGADCDGAEVLGFHLEGPCLNSEFRGAHPAEKIVGCDTIRLDEYLASDRIRMVTLAPELPGAASLVRELRHRGIVVGAGHSGASFEVMQDAKAWGISWGVHVLNAMPGLTARAPGLAGALLSDDELCAGVIADGVHVHPSVLKLIWRAKRDRQKLICTSDGSALVGMADGEYRIGSRTLFREGGIVRDASGRLAGSALTLDAAVRNLVEYVGCSLPEAVQCATSAPAQLLGEARKGRLRVGADADIVVLDSDGQVVATMQAGRLVYIAGKQTFSK